MRRLLVAALTMLVVAVPVAAGADTDEVALSTDGRTWSGAITESVLTDTPDLWVPGDSARGTFWVRNDGPSAAGLSVALDGRGRGDLLPDLQVDVTVGGRSATARGAGTTADDLGILEPGQRVRLAVDLGIVPSSQNQTQVDREGVLLRVVLTEVVAIDPVKTDPTAGPTDGPGGGGPQTGPDGDGDGTQTGAEGTARDDAASSSATATLTGLPSSELPGTGAPLDVWFVWAGALLVGAGAALVAARRRESA